MKKPIVILALIVTFFTSHSQNESYKDVLLEYMEVQGSLDSFNNSIDQMSQMMGGQIEADKLKPIMDEMFLSLVDALVPVYKNHLSIQDLKDGIEMYKTPIGKKIAQKTPLITQETMNVSMQWGMEFSSKIQELMQK
ncbi:MAG: DUF2059 domain-containing protein [Flavobacteriales bacterium]|jgi:hypothetical protein|tara:strand:- start:339 stop:749 length:411 start_codon:yes stop_codon:yes gene_type:complete